MAIRPSFQFYPDSWASNSKLKRCSHELKGIWVDILCLFHDSDEYGMLRWPLEELAQAVGTTIPKIKKLVSYGILMGGPKGTIVNGFKHVTKDGVEEILIPAQEGPLWFSPRQVRDEHFRQKRGKHGTKSVYNENVPKKKASKDTIEVSPPSPSPTPSSPSSPSPSPEVGSAVPNEGKNKRVFVGNRALASAIINQSNWEDTKDMFYKLWDVAHKDLPREYLLAFIMAAKSKDDPTGYLVTVLTGSEYDPPEKLIEESSKTIKEWEKRSA